MLTSLDIGLQLVPSPIIPFHPHVLSTVPVLGKVAVDKNYGFRPSKVNGLLTLTVDPVDTLIDWLGDYHICMVIDRLTRLHMSVGNIRIFNGCEVPIENSITRAHVTVRQASWCRTVIPRDGIFSSHRTIIRDSFSCIFFLRQLLHLNLCAVLFYQYNFEISIFSVK